MEVTESGIHIFGIVTIYRKPFYISGHYIKDIWLFQNPSLNVFAISQNCIHFRPLCTAPTIISQSKSAIYGKREMKIQHMANLPSRHCLATILWRKGGTWGFFCKYAALCWPLVQVQYGSKNAAKAKEHANEVNLRNLEWQTQTRKTVRKC